MKFEVCPKCGKSYAERPALSRRDGMTSICPECGTMEALDDIRFMVGKDMSNEEWEKYKRGIIDKMKGVV